MMYKVADTNHEFDEAAVELREWLESLDYVIKSQGGERAKELLRQLQNQLLQSGVGHHESTKLWSNCDDHVVFGHVWKFWAK